MISHECLQEHILCMWNLEQKYFEVGAHVLTIEVEDIYFSMSLSRRGAPVSLSGSREGDVTTQELIHHYCEPSTKMSGKKIPIKTVVDDALCTVLFTMQRLAGSQGPPQASRAHLLYAIESMASTIFNWVEALLPVFKAQLTKCR